MNTKFKIKKGDEVIVLAGKDKGKKGKIVKVWDNVKVKDHAKEVLETLQNIVKK